MPPSEHGKVAHPCLCFVYYSILLHKKTIMDMRTGLNLSYQNVLSKLTSIGKYRILWNMYSCRAYPELVNLSLSADDATTHHNSKCSQTITHKLQTI